MSMVGLLAYLKANVRQSESYMLSSTDSQRGMLETKERGGEGNNADNMLAQHTKVVNGNGCKNHVTWMSEQCNDDIY